MWATEHAGFERSSANGSWGSLHRQGVDAEPSGAVALAGALRAARRREAAVAVVSGGNTTARLHTLTATTTLRKDTP
ncbi:hypothetical protein ACWDMR_32675 [Streptomyces althioticus]|uniref:hypothetical protein n=1 Tax=Streptomyces TaxID=1883 RepID=UPI00099F3B02|nr:hypothetical protein [Streptomyces sp. MNU103]